MEKIEKSSYRSLYECIISDQVPPEDIAAYLNDKGFNRYYSRHRGMPKRTI